MKKATTTPHGEALSESRIVTELLALERLRIESRERLELADIKDRREAREAEREEVAHRAASFSGYLGLLREVLDGVLPIFATRVAPPMTTTAPRPEPAAAEPAAHAHTNGTSSAHVNGAVNLGTGR